MPLNEFLAVGEFTATATPEQLNGYMNEEVPATRKLYVDGKMDQFWLRLDGKGVVFVMTTETRAGSGGSPAWTSGSAAVHSDPDRHTHSAPHAHGRTLALNS